MWVFSFSDRVFTRMKRSLGFEEICPTYYFQKNLQYLQTISVTAVTRFQCSKVCLVMAAFSAQIFQQMRRIVTFPRRQILNILSLKFYEQCMFLNRFSKQILPMTHIFLNVLLFTGIANLASNVYFYSFSFWHHKVLLSPEWSWHACHIYMTLWKHNIGGRIWAKKAEGIQILNTFNSLYK